jgi:hypothetical protein
VASSPPARGRSSRVVEDYLAFRAALRAVLRIGDADELGAFLRTSAMEMGDRELAAMGRNQRGLEELMHRLVLAEVELADLHGAARAWLRLRGRPVPPAARGYGRPNLQGERLLRTA